MSALGQALAAAGFTVDDHPVPGRSATWHGVKWIMVHHYAGSEDPAAAAEAARAKTMTSTPPICQLYLDLTGKVWIISQERPGQAEPGRASHAGTGSYPGIPTDSGNTVALGIECQCSGRHPLSTHPDLYAALIRLCAFLVDRYGLDASRVIGHREYAPTRKIDPVDDVDVIRADVAASLTGGNPPPAAEGEEPGPMFIVTRRGHWYAVMIGPSGNLVGITLGGDDGNAGCARLDLNNDASWAAVRDVVAFDHPED